MSSSYPIVLALVLQEDLSSIIYINSPELQEVQLAKRDAILIMQSSP